MEKYIPYFDNICKEDIEDVTTICNTASIIIYDRFKAKLDDPKLVGVIFSKIFDTILDTLEQKEQKYSEFKLNICDRLMIGYSTNQNEEDEKMGNFMIFVRHSNMVPKYDTEIDPTANSVERAVQWNTNNIKDQPDILREISAAALDKLKKMDIYLGSSELVLPIFITIYECIVNYIKIKRKEEDSFEYEINFMSCFFIGARESEDNDSDIYIRPNIESKLKLKNDGVASAKYDE